MHFYAWFTDGMNTVNRLVTLNDISEHLAWLKPFARGFLLWTN